MRKFLILLICLGALWGADAQLSLSDCISAALSANETVKIQELKVEEIKAKVWAKTAAMLPYIGASAGFTHLRTNTDAYDASLILTQPIFAGGKYWADRALSRLELEQAELELEKAKQDLSLDVAAAYYRLWHAQEILSANIESRGNLRDYYNRSTQLAAQTRLPRPEELLQVEVQLGNAEIAVSNAELAAKKACNTLENLTTGFFVSKKVTYRDDKLLFFDFIASPTLNAAMTTLSSKEVLGENYEYRLALLTERQRKAAAKISAGDFFPEINLQAYSGVEWGDTFPKDETTYSQWGISLQMLLFDFWRTPKQVEQSHKIFEQAALDSDRIGRNILIRDADVYATLRTDADTMTLTAQNLAKAQRSLKLYQERGQSYTANSKQLLDAEQAALQARTNYLDSVLDYNLNAVEHKRLLGEGAL